MTITLDRDRHRPRPRRCADRAREGEAGRAHAPLGRVLRPRQRRDARRRPVAVPEERPVARLPRARRGRARLGRRRQRVPRLPQRLRRHVRRPCQPVIAAAVKARMDAGTPLRGPDRGLDHRRRGAARRWGLPHWRFTNSGTESTMDAVHLARGATGNDILVKIEGTYHGHHDAVMVSVKPPAELMGDRDRPNAVPYGLGYPSTTAAQTQPVPFNDADALERMLVELDGQVAGMILEPAMMNINIVPPVPGYLERVRELARRARRRADLRRGQDRRGRRGRRRDRAVRRHARRRLPRQGDLRRPARRRGRHDRGARRARRRRPRAPAGHVQRQPARDGRRAGDAARRAHARRLRAAAQGQRRADGRLRPRDRRVRPAGAHGRHGLEGLRRDGDRADPRVPRLPHADPPRADRAGVALPHEPRRLHDARASTRSGRCRCSTRTPTCGATSRCSRRSRAT